MHYEYIFNGIGHNGYYLFDHGTVVIVATLSVRASLLENLLDVLWCDRMAV